MPTRVVQLDRTGEQVAFVLWAAVPAGQEPRYRSPTNGSAYLGITTAELDNLRSGVVTERIGRFSVVGLTQAQIDVALQLLWQQYQDAVTAGTEWAQYGRTWDGTSWIAGGPSLVPPITQQADEDLPTFFALTPITAFSASRFHLVLWNASTSYLIRVRHLCFLPQPTALTGVAPSAWTLRRRIAPTTVPAGGDVTAIPADSAVALPTGISVLNVPTTAPAGGTAQDILTFVPQADEQKLSTLDAPTFASLQPFAGMAVWASGILRPSVPLILRPQQTLEIQQSGTAGVGNARLFLIFSVKDAR